MGRIPAFTSIVVCAMTAVWIAFGSLLLPMARNHDFLNLYTGASLALDGQFAQLHDPAVQLERERRFVPRTAELVPFVRPAFYALLLAPLALLPYKIAFWVWIGLQCVLLAGCAAWGLRRFGPDALVFASLYLPAPLGIASGQDCVVLLALLILAYELAERKCPNFGLTTLSEPNYNEVLGDHSLAVVARKRVVVFSAVCYPFASGALLAAMLIKFHLILLWPLGLALQRRWKMLAGFCAMAAVEVSATLALGGFTGAKTCIALLRNRDLSHLAPSPELMVSVDGFAANLGLPALWIRAAVIGLIVLTFSAAAFRAPLWRLFCLTSAASLFIAPHAYGYDAALLLLPIWLAIFRSRRPLTRIAATLLSTPIPFGFALAGKPWAIVSSLSLFAFFLILASEAAVQSEGDATNLYPTPRTVST